MDVMYQVLQSVKIYWRWRSVAHSLAPVHQVVFELEMLCGSVFRKDRVRYTTQYCKESCIMFKSIKNGCT
jgi:hypothetical protein